MLASGIICLLKLNFVSDLGANANQAPEVDCSILQVAACAFLVDADSTKKDGLAETDEALDARCE